MYELRVVIYDQVLTEEKEKEVVSNGRYTCSKFTAIAIIIKAATLIGRNEAVN